MPDDNDTIKAIETEFHFELTTHEGHLFIFEGIMLHSDEYPDMQLVSMTSITIDGKPSVELFRAMSQEFQAEAMQRLKDEVIKSYRKECADQQAAAGDTPIIEASTRLQ